MDLITEANWRVSGRRCHVGRNEKLVRPVRWNGNAISGQVQRGSVSFGIEVTADIPTSALYEQSKELTGSLADRIIYEPIRQHREYAELVAHRGHLAERIDELREVARKSVDADEAIKQAVLSGGDTETAQQTADQLGKQMVRLDEAVGLLKDSIEGICHRIKRDCHNRVSMAIGVERREIVRRVEKLNEDLRIAIAEDLPIRKILCLMYTEAQSNERLDMFSGREPGYIERFLRDPIDGATGYEIDHEAPNPQVEAGSPYLLT